MKTTAYVLSIGVINITTGKTSHEWDIYDARFNAMVYLTDGNFLFYSAPGTFTVGDEVQMVGNDSGRLAGNRSGYKIVDYAPCVKEEVLPMLKRNSFDYYPIQAYRARPKGNKKLGTSYSVKGNVEGFIK